MQETPTQQEKQLPLPPGSTGLPVLGETLSFMKDGFTFVRERAKKYGDVFRTSILGRPTAVLVGADGGDVFVDETLVERKDAFPSHIRDLFGGDSILTLDADAHRARRSVISAAFSKEALASYLPIVQSTMERALARWAEAPEIEAIGELKALAIEVICRTMASIEEPVKLREIVELYGVVGGGFSSLPVPIPGTAFSKALNARDKLLAFFGEIVDDHREKPRDDGLGRVLKANEAAAEKLDDDALRIELHHLVIAGYIVFAQCAAILRALADHPELRAKALAEVEAHAGTGEITGAVLRALPYVHAFTQEVKRTTPMFPLLFTRAKTSFTFKGHSIPKGWMVCWAIAETNHGETWSSPSTFDPTRFDRGEEKKHAHAFVPQGAGPHKCPGIDLSTVFMQTFVALVLRGYTHAVPAQDFAMDWGKTPPEPKAGLRVSLLKKK